MLAPEGTRDKGIPQCEERGSTLHKHPEGMLGRAGKGGGAAGSAAGLENVPTSILCCPLGLGNAGLLPHLMLQTGPLGRGFLDKKRMELLKTLLLERNVRFL